MKLVNQNIRFLYSGHKHVANLKVRNASLKLQEEALAKNNQQKAGPFREVQSNTSAPYKNLCRQIPS